MKTTVKAILFLAVILVHANLCADNVITFFMRPFPHLPETREVTAEQAARKSEKLQKPGKIAKYTLRSLLESNAASGIFCTYKGQLAISNSDGQVVFARRQREPDLHVLVSQKINPIFEYGQIINHWETEVGVPAQLYLVKQEEDIATDMVFWNVTKVEPEKRTVPLDAIVIFAKPKHILVPEGISLTKKGSQLILPDMYIKKNVDKLTNSLYVLNLKRFFSPNKRKYQVKPNLYQKHVY